jgi:hypothetical protein
MGISNSKTPRNLVPSVEKVERHGACDKGENTQVCCIGNAA